jgi:hypothetical protein
MAVAIAFLRENAGETIQGRKLSKGGNYARKYGQQEVELLCAPLTFSDLPPALQ